MHVEIESKKVTLYWQNNAESFLDPISQEADFEGYRIYGARKTDNESLGEFSLLLEADKENDIGYNTGFSMIEIRNNYGEPDSINTVSYTHLTLPTTPYE